MVQKMAAKIHNFEDHNKDNKYKDLIKNTQLIIKENISQMMKDIFDETDDVIFKSAEDSDNQQDRNALFDMMRELRLERNNITNSYLKSLYQSLSSKSNTESEPESLDELSLVSHDDMEEIVAFGSIVNQQEDLHTEALSHLHARIEHLSLKSNFILNKEAISPKQFCDSFSAAYEKINFDTNSKLIFIKVFSRFLGNTLTKTYDTINYRFIEADILPQIKVSAKKQPAQRDNQAHNNFYTMAPVDGNDSFQQGNYPVSQDLQQVIHSYIQDNIPDSAVTQINQQNFYDRKQVLDSLSNLQFKFSQSHQPISFELINKALLSNINSGSGGLITKQVNHVDEKTIEVIELLFNEILNDETLTSAVRTLILRLQIPTIKVAMLDQEFFNNTNHPARLFLNTLSFVGIGITDEDDEFLSRIEIIIDTLLNDFEQDSISFQQALDDLNKLFNKEINTCQRKENHTQKRILQEHAKKIVLQELQQLAHGKTISKKSEPLILKLWPTQMYQQYINYGKDSDQWTESVNTLRLIINSIQKPTTQKELQFIVSNQDKLLQTVQDKLYESKQDLNAINLAIYTLSETYLDTINSSDIESDDENPFENFSLDTFSGTISDIKSIKPDLLAANQDIELTDDMPAIVEDKREQLQSLPTDIKPGLWFELYDGDDKPVRRLKLSVIIMEDAQLIFVNRQGVKIMEKNALKFAEELESEKSKMIADHSIFDQALSNVITALSAS